MPKAKGIAETISITQLLRMFPHRGICIKWLERVRWNAETASCGNFADSRPAVAWQICNAALKILVF